MNRFLRLLLLSPLAPPALCQENVLVMVGDDLGVDRIGAYAEHPDPGRTPNIDALAAGGVLFRNAWSNPLCSPTRATLLTGRYSYRTGMGTNAMWDGTGPALDPGEVLLPQILFGYSNTAVGKWHLSHDILHPNLSGFTHFAGTTYNLDHQQNGPANYFQWTKMVDGQGTVTTTYATTDAADEAIAAIQSLPEPWFIYCAFHAPHTPVHEPPAHLHTYNLSGNPGDDQPLFVRAMIEAMDTEIGRVLTFVPSNTFVFFIGDNGTAESTTDPPSPPNHNKRTIFEGGINVPFIVAGPGIVPGEAAGLVNTTDLYATVAEIAGVSSAAEDSISLLPYFSDPAQPSLREWVYAEKFHGNITLRAIRGPRYKLMRTWDPNFSERFFDLQLDPYEGTDLLSGTLTAQEQEAYERLACAMPPGIESQSYCTAVANSSGQPASIAASGSNLVEVGALCLQASDLPTNRFGYFLASMTQGFVPTPPGSVGNLCLGGQIARFAKEIRNSGSKGTYELYVDLERIPLAPPLAVQPGDTWNFQGWFRDVSGASNFTDGVLITFE